MDINTKNNNIVIYVILLKLLFSCSISQNVTNQNRCVMTCKIKNRNDVPCTVTEVGSVSVCTVMEEIRRLFTSTKLPNTRVSSKLVKRTSSTRTTYGLNFGLYSMKHLGGFLVQINEENGVKSSKYYMIKLGRKFKSRHEDFELGCVTTADVQFVEYQIWLLPSNKKRNKKTSIAKRQRQKQTTKCFSGLKSLIHNREGYCRKFYVKDAEEIGCISGCLKTNQLTIRQSTNGFNVEIFTLYKQQTNISVIVTDPGGTVVDGSYSKKLNLLRWTFNTSIPGNYTTVIKMNNFCCEDVKRTVEFVCKDNSTSLTSKTVEYSTQNTVVNIVILLICVPFCIVTIAVLVILLYWLILGRLIKKKEHQGLTSLEQFNVLLITTETDVSNPSYTKAIEDLTELLKQYHVNVITLYSQSSHKMYNKYDWLETVVRKCQHAIFVTSKDMYDLFKSKQENKGYTFGNDLAFYAFSVIRSESRLDKNCHVLSLCESELKYSYVKEFSQLYSLLKKSTKMCLTKLICRNNSIEIIFNNNMWLRLVNIITGRRNKHIHQNHTNMYQYQYKLLESIKEYICFNDRNTHDEILLQ